MDELFADRWNRKWLASGFEYVGTEMVACGADVLPDEDRFRTRQFVNSSVRQLAECLLAYMGEREPERFRSAVQVIDPAALAERSFWWREATGLGTEG